MRVVLASFAIFCCVIGNAQDPGPVDRPQFAQPSQETELWGRRPELLREEDVRKWVEDHGVSAWYETPLNDDKLRTVVIQGLDSSQIFAAQVQIDLDSLKASVERLQAINTRGMSNSRAQAENFLEEANKEPLALRPVVTFLANGYQLEFEAESVEADGINRFHVNSDGQLNLLENRPFPSNVTPAPTAGADDLASDELHHLALFKEEAEKWTTGLTNDSDKARALVREVYKSYTYDSLIKSIGEFTWSDVLVRDVNKRRGICDEYSVVLISYLRALGIPSRYKLLVWKKGAVQEAHACAEFKDGNVWRHVDATWNEFDNPECYRASSAANVTVMDADHPSDARASAPCWGKVDLPDDAKLNPYDDFILGFPFPGKPVQRYSF